jgi:hypothetical protein
MLQPCVWVPYQQIFLIQRLQARAMLRYLACLKGNRSRVRRSLKSSTMANSVYGLMRTLPWRCTPIPRPLVFWKINMILGALKPESSVHWDKAWSSGGSRGFHVLCLSTLRGLGFLNHQEQWALLCFPPVCLLDLEVRGAGELPLSSLGGWPNPGLEIVKTKCFAPGQRPLRSTEIVGGHKSVLVGLSLELASALKQLCSSR